MKELRWEQILRLLKDKNILLVNEIVEMLNISISTVRRDLTEMEKKGIVKRTHGGVMLIDNKTNAFEEQIDAKIQHNFEEKNLIAKKAAKLVKQAMSVYLDAGSSTLALIKVLDPKLKLIVITNSLLHADLLSIAGFNEIYLLGGKYKRSTGALIGWEALNTLQKYNIDIAFLGVNGIYKDSLYTTDPEEAMIKAEVIKKSQHSYVLADSSKFNKKTLVKFASKNEVQIITLNTVNK